MPEYAPSNDLSQQKRRSSRIVQAVPVTVIGTDALGQAFKERTSTLVVNSHGCKYQSKHYVLKNRWVTLEVPHPQQGHESRRVRARVISIQRPRTVRELFQIGAELELPGNVWGIAFPPGDWFEFPDESESAEIPPPAEDHGPPLSAVEDRIAAVPGLGPDAPGPEAARQLERLLGEARQEVGQMAREAARRAAETEARGLLAELSGQLHEAAERAVESVAGRALEEAAGRAVVRIEESAHAQTRAFEERWQKQLDETLAAAASRLAERSAAVAREQTERFAARLEGDAAKTIGRLSAAAARVEQAEVRLGQAAGEAEERFARLRGELDASSEAASERWRQRLSTLEAETVERLTQLELAVRALRDDIATAGETARQRVRAEFDAELAAARERWKQAIEQALASAATDLSGRLDELVRKSAAGAEKSLEARAREIRSALEKTAGETRKMMEQVAGEALGRLDATARETCDSVADAAARAAVTIADSRGALDEGLSRSEAWLAQIENRARELERIAREGAAIAERAGGELERKFQEALKEHRAELDRQAGEQTAAALAGIQPKLDEAVRGALLHFAEELDGAVGRQRELVAEMQAEIAEARHEAEQSLAATRNRLDAAAEESAAAAVARARERFAALEQEFDAAGGAALDRWNQELDARAREVRHTTIEELLRSSEWYQKKAQTGMQSALEKALEQALDGLRERAAEVSRVFTSELDHYSRSYGEQSREKIEEAAREVLERSRGELASAAAALSESFAEDARRVEDEQARRMAAVADAAVEETAAQVAARAAQARGEMEAHAAMAAAGFERRVAESASGAVRDARAAIEAALAPLVERLAAARAAEEAAWREAAARQTEAALEEFRERLENASNSWLLASATTLNQRSQAALDRLTETAEHRMRLVAVRVLAGLAETIRSEMLGLSSELEELNPPGRSANSASAGE